MVTDTRERLIRQLHDDLLRLRETLWDEEFGAELYRALTNRVWQRDGQEGEVALSWRRAADLVDELRREVDRPPLGLEATGGEGELSDRVAAALGALGWSSRALDTSRHEEVHVTSGGEPAAGPAPGRYGIPLHVRVPAAMPRLVEEVHNRGHREAVAHPAPAPETWTIELDATSRDAAAEAVWVAIGRAGVGAEITFLHTADIPVPLRRR